MSDSKTTLFQTTQKCAYFVAIGFGAGLLPKGPGTAGSFVGVLIALILKKTLDATLTNSNLVWGEWALILSILLLAWYCIAVAEKRLGKHDDQRIVIDEIAAVCLIYLPLSLTITNFVMGFVFFRLFDIFKPGPIRLIDRSMKNALGTLLDDLLAAGATLLVIFTINFIFQI